VITFSIHNDSHVRAENVLASDNGITFTLKLLDGESVVISLNVHGQFNVYNALAASAVCASLGVTASEIKSALDGYTAFPMRFEVHRRGGLTVINDSYNANPSSMEESLKELIRMKRRGRAVAVLGDMLELGKFSEDAHRSVGKLIKRLEIDVFVSVGEMMRLAVEECQSMPDETTRNESLPETHDFCTAEEAVQKVKEKIVQEGDAVLIKGSRAMGMEKIFKGLVS
jgi:UDP-N-acetylmuramoyl-tripeptide--D-alanyl-D-alanine ligase